MKNIFKNTILFGLLTLIVASCSNNSSYINSNTGSVDILVSGEVKPSENARNIYLSGAWYRQDNSLFPDESTWVLSGDHYNYAISFRFLSKKNLLKNCIDQLKNKEQQWLCFEKNDDKKLKALFDIIDGTNNQEKNLVEALHVLYSRAHNAKRIDTGKVIFTAGSSQDPMSMFPLYITKIDQDRYLEIMAFPDIICDKDSMCKGKIPRINEKTGLDPYWDFIWSGVTVGEFYDPLIGETYDQMFFIEKNWQSIIKNAIAW